jgi:hypothetical protein
MQDVDFPVKGVDNLGNEMIMMPGEEYTFPGDYVVETPMAQAGGTKPSFNFQSKPTRADSLDLYNRSLNIDKYYNNLKNKGWYKNVVIKPTDGLTSEGLKKQMEQVDKESRVTYIDQSSSPYNRMGNMYPTADPRKYNQAALKEHIALTKGTRYATKDNAPAIIDPMAPTTVIDTRIIPKEKIIYYDRKTSAAQDYYKSIKNLPGRNLTPAQQVELDNILKKTPGKTPAGGEYTMLYRYDPLSIKPWDLLTDSEKELRVKKYGRDGVPDSYKPLKAKIKPTALKTSKPTAPVNNTTSTETPIVTKVESTPAPTVTPIETTPTPKVERKVVSVTPEEVKAGTKTTSGKQIGSGTAGGRIYRVKYDNGETEILNEFEYRSRGLKMQAGGQFDFVRNQSPNPITNFEKRMYNNTNKIQNEDGSYSTHKMLNWSDDNGFYVAPTIVEINGKLKELSENEAIEHAYKTGELKSFKSGQEAQEYANNGYKKGTPMEFLEGGQTGWLDNYQEGGQRMYPAPSLEFQKRVQDNIRRNQVQPTFVRREPITVSQTDNTRTNAVENAKRDLESYTPQERAYFAQNNIPRDQWFSAKAKMQNDAVLKRREEVKRQAQADVRNNPFAITPATNEQLRNEFRAFPNDPNSFFDEYLNPAQMIGNMAASIGDNFTGEGPIDPWKVATDIITPAFVGMTAGIGAQNTGQFANNLINPLAGTGQLVNRLGNRYLPNAYQFNPYAFKPKADRFYRQIGEPGFQDAMQEGKVFAKGQKEFLERNPDFNYVDDYNEAIDFQERSGGFNLKKPAVAPFFVKSELFFPISNKTGFGRGKTKASDVTYLLEGKIPDEAILPRYRDKYLTQAEFQGDIRGNRAVGVLRPEYNDLSNFRTYKKDWLQGYKQLDNPRMSGGVGSNVSYNTAPSNSLDMPTSQMSREQKLQLMNDVDNFIRREGEVMTEQLNSPEGRKRLRNQFEQANPNLSNIQLAELIDNRLESVALTTRLNRAKWLKARYDSLPNDVEKERFLDFEDFNYFFPYKNAHYGHQSLFVTRQGNETTDNLLDLSKGIKTNSFLSNDPAPGYITLGPGFTTSKPTLSHEVGHSIQKGGKMPLDNELNKLVSTFGTNPSLKSFVDDSYRVLNLKGGVKEFNNLYNQLNYFKKGSKGREPTAFARELRQAMLDQGVIKDIYQEITPEILNKAKRKMPTLNDDNRLLHIVPQYDYKKLSSLMNKLPVAVPAAVGVGAALNTKEKGGETGWLDKYK